MRTTFKSGAFLISLPRAAAPPLGFYKSLLCRPTKLQCEGIKGVGLCCLRVCRACRRLWPPQSGFNLFPPCWLRKRGEGGLTRVGLRWVGGWCIYSEGWPTLLCRGRRRRRSGWQTENKYKVSRLKDTIILTSTVPGRETSCTLSVVLHPIHHSSTGIT